MDFFLLEGMYEVVVVFYCTNLSSEVYIFFGFIISYPYPLHSLF
jgi:hypothetical protein